MTQNLKIAWVIVPTRDESLILRVCRTKPEADGILRGTTSLRARVETDPRIISASLVKVASFRH